MAIKGIIARGIGFNQGTKKFIVTGGFLGALIAVPVTSSTVINVVPVLECATCGFTYNHDTTLRGFTRDHNNKLVCKFDFDPPHPNDRKPKIRPVKGPQPVR